jgi:hypothetical protein
VPKKRVVAMQVDKGTGRMYLIEAESLHALVPGGCRMSPCREIDEDILGTSGSRYGRQPIYLPQRYEVLSPPWKLRVDDPNVIDGAFGAEKVYYGRSLQCQ